MTGPDIEPQVRDPQRPLVSVVIPTKNRAELVCETVESVRRQTYPNWEAVVVDDGSEDDTVATLSDLAQKESRLRILKREGAHGGAPVCRNQGAAAARGEYLVFLDSDDLLAPHCLERRVAAMEAEPTLDFAVFRCEYFHHEPGDEKCAFPVAIPGNDLDCFLRLGWPWQTPSVIWRRDAFKSTGGWDSRLNNWQDVVLHITALATSPNYKRFTDIDCFIRHSSFGHVTLSDSIPTVNYLHAYVQGLTTIQGILKSNGKLNDRRRLILSGVHFWLVERLLAHRHRALAIQTWRASRDRGLTSWRRYTAVRFYIRLHPFFLSPLAFAMLYDSWPDTATLLGQAQAPASEESERESIIQYEPWQPFDPRNRAMVNVGWIKRLARLVIPGRVRASMMSKRARWLGKHSVRDTPPASKASISRSSGIVN